MIAVAKSLMMLDLTKINYWANSIQLQLYDHSVIMKKDFLS